MNDTSAVRVFHVEMPEEGMDHLVCDLTVSYGFTILGHYRARKILPTNTISTFTVSKPLHHMIGSPTVLSTCPHDYFMVIEHCDRIVIDWPVSIHKHDSALVCDHHSHHLHHHATAGRGVSAVSGLVRDAIIT